MENHICVLCAAGHECPGIDSTMCNISMSYELVHYRDLGRPSEYLPREAALCLLSLILSGAVSTKKKPTCVFWIIRECVDKQR